MLRVENLKKRFIIGHGFFSGEKAELQAVDGVSFEVSKGSTMGLVGESGCGKSTLARLILRLIEPSGGEVWLNGRNIYSMDRKNLRDARREMQMIFQDPYASLNPRMTAGEIVGEPLLIHAIARGSELTEMVVDMMARVGLTRVEMKKYPHEFSGGQRQRIGIARALILNPALIVADEPVSSLDVSIQAQIINLMIDLQEEFGLAYLVISHDLAMVRHISDITAVMYLGRIVEIAPTSQLFDFPRHPYTEALICSIPRFVSRIEKDRMILKGEVPNPINPPRGCPFHPRCYLYAETKNKRCTEPQMLKGDGSHMTACHLRS